MTEEKLSIQDTLRKLGACSNAREWAKDKTWPEIFNTCHRGDWLLWLFKRTNPDNLKELTRAKAYCALTVRPLMKDQRSVNACEVSLRFADGLATRDELNAAYADAYAAYADAADADAAAATADAASAAAAATADAADAYAATAAASAAAAATATADAADAYAATATADAAYAYAATDAAYAATDADADAAADSAADAAYAATAAADARIKNKKETADICRKYLPIEIWNLR